MMAKIQCMAKVTEVSVLAEGIVSMWLSAPGVAKSAKPGQFISLYCDNSDTLLPRPISLCEVNQKDGLLRIVFRIVGAGTKKFAAKKKDDEIRILGPLGNGFPLDACEKDKTAVLIGGGIGIPPLLELQSNCLAKQRWWLATEMPMLLRKNGRGGRPCCNCFR
ncbi:MAG: hypothetical protein ACLSD6_00980 [Clostridium sp.]